MKWAKGMTASTMTRAVIQPGSATLVSPQRRRPPASRRRLTGAPPSAAARGRASLSHLFARSARSPSVVTDEPHVLLELGRHLDDPRHLRAQELETVDARRALGAERL